ncbi:MAG: GNAT family N-acetyltransferase [Acidimicrobiia bacterium]|nr:GNAT family N-acetyltransferase [Acidimicrobiia bacterium]
MREEIENDPIEFDGPIATYTVRELKVSERELLDRILDRFTPGWQDNMAPGASGSLSFVADSSTFVFGAFQGEMVVGYASGYRLRLPNGKKSLLMYDLEVADDHRRQGLGILLLQSVLNLGKREGCAEMWLVTEADNEPAIGLYSAAGGRVASGSAGDIVFEWTFESSRWTPRRQSSQNQG